MGAWVHVGGGSRAALRRGRGSEVVCVSSSLFYYPPRKDVSGSRSNGQIDAALVTAADSDSE